MLKHHESSSTLISACSGGGGGKREREFFIVEGDRAPVDKATLPRNWGGGAFCRDWDGNNVKHP